MYQTVITQTVDILHRHYIFSLTTEMPPPTRDIEIDDLPCRSGCGAPITCVTWDIRRKRYVVRLEDLDEDSVLLALDLFPDASGASEEEIYTSTEKLFEGWRIDFIHHDDETKSVGIDPETREEY